MVSAADAVFFEDINGIALGTGDQTFGDFAFNSVSTPITNRFDAASKDTVKMQYIEQEKQVWVKLDSSADLQVFHPLGGQWTRYRFTDVEPVSFRELNGSIYIGGNNGTVYELVTGKWQDDGKDITYLLKTKAHTFSTFRDIIVKELSLNIVSGNTLYGTLVCEGSEQSVSLDISQNVGTYIYDATMKIYNADSKIYSAVKTIRQRLHLVCDYIQFTLKDIDIYDTPVYIGDLIIKYIIAGRYV